MKPVKRGFKIWVLACGQYTFNFQVCTRKTVNSALEKGLGERVVLELCKPVHNSGRIAVMDNFSSVNLFEELKEKGIGAVGTIRKDRKGLANVQTKGLKRGDAKKRK